MTHPEDYLGLKTQFPLTKFYHINYPKNLDLI